MLDCPTRIRMIFRIAALMTSRTHSSCPICPLAKIHRGRNVARDVPIHFLDLAKRIRIISSLSALSFRFASQVVNVLMKRTSVESDRFVMDVVPGSMSSHFAFDLHLSKLDP